MMVMTRSVVRRIWRVAGHGSIEIVDLEQDLDAVGVEGAKVVFLVRLFGVAPNRHAVNGGGAEGSDARS